MGRKQNTVEKTALSLEYSPSIIHVTLKKPLFTVGLLLINTAEERQLKIITWFNSGIIFGLDEPHYKKNTMEILY